MAVDNAHVTPLMIRQMQEGEQFPGPGVFEKKNLLPQY
jgi:hypothetical protein